MTSSRSKSRIVGVTLGEAAINLRKPGIPPLTADFGMVRDDEEFVGLYQRRFEWSEKTMKALAALQASMEQDAIDHLFEEQPPEAQAAEPQQV